MSFDFDIMRIKGNNNPYVDAISRVEFGKENVENHDNAENKIAHKVETDVLPLNQARY